MLTSTLSSLRWASTPVERTLRADLSAGNGILAAMPVPDPHASMDDVLRAHLMGLPLARFQQDPDHGPADYLSGLLDVPATERPWVYCAHLGAWQTGTTIVFALPAALGGGVAATYDTHEGSRAWNAVSTVGGRADRAIGWTREVRAASSASDLSLALAAEAIDHEAEFVASGYSLNARPVMCMLAHVLASLPDSERAAVEMLISLRYPLPVAAKVTALVASADALVANLPRSREVEPVLSRAIETVAGVRMSGAQVESLQLSEALMGTPYDRWEGKALELAREAAEADRQQKTITAGRLFHPLSV